MAQYIEAAAAALELINAVEDTAQTISELNERIKSAYDSISVSVKKIFGVYTEMYQPQSTYIRAFSQPWVRIETFVMYLSRINTIDFFHKDERKRISGMLQEIATRNELIYNERFPEKEILIQPYSPPLLKFMIDLHHSLSIPTAVTKDESVEYSNRFYASLEQLLTLASKNSFDRSRFEDDFNLTYQ